MKLTFKEERIEEPELQQRTSKKKKQSRDLNTPLY
jgi:hypothetical protein